MNDLKKKVRASCTKRGRSNTTDDPFINCIVLNSFFTSKKTRIMFYSESWVEEGLL